MQNPWIRRANGIYWRNPRKWTWAVQSHAVGGSTVTYILMKWWVCFRLRVTKYHWLSGLFINNLLTVPETGKSRIKALADSVSGEAPSPVLRWLSFHCILPWWKGRGPLWGLFHEGASPVHGGSTLMTSSLPKGPASKYHHFGDWGSTGIWGGDTKHSVYSKWLSINQKWLKNESSTPLLIDLKPTILLPGVS